MKKYYPPKVIKKAKEYEKQFKKENNTNQGDYAVSLTKADYYFRYKKDD